MHCRLAHCGCNVGVYIKHTKLVSWCFEPSQPPGVTQGLIKHTKSELKADKYYHVKIVKTGMNRARH